MPPHCLTNWYLIFSNKIYCLFMKEKMIPGIPSITKILLAVIVVLFLTTVFLLQRTIRSAGVLANVARYSLLSPRILQEYHNDILINFLPLRQRLRTLTSAHGDSFALYFEYLPTGTSIGIREKEEFAAASLIKIPVIMAYYRQKDRLGDKIGEKEITIEEKHIDKGSGTLWQKGVGAKIALKEVVRLAIVESDNTATRVLGDYVSDEDFTTVYEGLDIDLKTGEDGTILTTKHYSSVLKALYFSAVLSKDHSQEILTLMTKTIYIDKLPAGVPNTVPVAHKVGVLDKREYMDCGIVYIPKRPYLLCMVSFSDEKTATERMSSISKEVYDFVSEANKSN